MLHCEDLLGEYLNSAWKIISECNSIYTLCVGELHEFLLEIGF